MTETADDRCRDLTIDQQLTLRTAAGHLRTEFDGVFGHETIEGVRERRVRGLLDELCVPRAGRSQRHVRNDEPVNSATTRRRERRGAR